MNKEDLSRLENIIETAGEQRRYLLEALGLAALPPTTLLSAPEDKPETASKRIMSLMKATLADVSWIKQQAECVLRSQQTQIIQQRPSVEL